MRALKSMYDGNYKKYLVVPLLLFIACSFLAFVYPGVPKGIDLSGGTLIIIKAEKPLDAKQAEDMLAENFALTDLSVVSTSSPLGGHGLTIRFASNPDIAAAERYLALARGSLDQPQTAFPYLQSAMAALSKYVEPVQLPEDAQKAVEEVAVLLVDAKESFNNRIQQLITQRFGLGENVAFQKREVSPTLGTAFYATAFNVAIAALVLVMIVVFLFFRKVVPSIAVIASALLDVVGALGLMALFQIPLTLSSIPALLMLIGYSIDTDVMLTTKVLQRREHIPTERAYDAMVTGLTMTGTTIAALLAMLLLSFVAQMLVVFEIASVLLLGLLVDLSSTWLMNAPVLLWYVERQAKTK